MKTVTFRHYLAKIEEPITMFDDERVITAEFDPLHDIVRVVTAEDGEYDIESALQTLIAPTDDDPPLPPMTHADVWRATHPEDELVPISLAA